MQVLAQLAGPEVQQHGGWLVDAAVHSPLFIEIVPAHSPVLWRLWRVYYCILLQYTVLVPSTYPMFWPQLIQQPHTARSHYKIYKYNQHQPTNVWLWKQLKTFQEQLIHAVCFLLFMAGMYLRSVHVVYCMCIRLYSCVFAYSCTHRIVYVTCHLMSFAFQYIFNHIQLQVSSYIRHHRNRVDPE